MRFLLDENIPRSSLAVFRELNQEAEHVSDVGLKGAGDIEVIAYARKKESIVVTRNADFGTLVVFRHVPAYGIVMIKLPYTATASTINQVLRAFLAAVKMIDLEHVLVIVESGRYRIRQL